MPAKPRQSISNEQSRSERKRWNVPDWTKPEEYDYVNGLTRDQLRWEFLRRNNKYRQQSEMKSQPFAHLLIGRYIKPNIRGDKLPKDFSFADSIRRGEGLAIKPPSVKMLLFKKGDPDPQYNINAYYGAQLNELWEQNYIIIAFDPCMAIPSQIKTATKCLERAKKDIEKQAPEMLPISGSRKKMTLRRPSNLLRALDADNEKVTLQKIGFEIFKAKSYGDAIPIAKDHLTRALSYWRSL